MCYFQKKMYENCKAETELHKIGPRLNKITIEIGTDAYMHGASAAA
jgi:hypothetical protein